MSTDMPPASAVSGAIAGAEAYRVLARKYRPANFAQLIGQDAMVRTLTNALRAGRIPHAFVLTGVRGVGKTTTARIIARALNCVGPDGKGGPTIAPCGQCEPCIAIAEDRHVDVLEIDAASRTGVDDIREILDGVRYRPVAARYKIYIVDEVHMLSKNAFNALLKTLEEPPPHVIFIFATTEIRRVPVTVLSRCMRFDLRRIEAGALAAHLASVAEKEGARIDAGAARMLARAADGSVRDGLSLLDQALALVSDRQGAAVGEADIRAMLGLADRGLVIDLFDSILRGDAKEALARIASLYEAGADPVTVLQDLLELTHGLTALKVAPDAALAESTGESERPRLAAMAAKLRLSVLTRAWQMLLKGLGEARVAPDPRQALEMIVIRLVYAAELPTPADVITSLRGGASPQGGPAPQTGSGVPPALPDRRGPAMAPAGGGSRSAGSGFGGREGPQALKIDPPSMDPGPVVLARQNRDPEPQTAPQVAPEMVPEIAPLANPQSFAAAVQLFAERREGTLHTHLRNDVHLVRFEPGRIELAPGPYAPANLANRVGDLLSQWTGKRWVASVTNTAGQPTLRDQEQAEATTRRQAALSDPLLQAVLRAFPGATVESIRTPQPASPAADFDPTLEPPVDDGDLPA